MAILDWLLDGANTPPQGARASLGRPGLPFSRRPRGDDADSRDKTRQRRAPEVGGFFPGDQGSFSERTIQDRYPAYTVATATKGTSGC